MIALHENATKDNSRKVWVSYGVFIVLLPFLDAYQILCLQITNKFCYEIAVSRVQYTMQLRMAINFTWPNGGYLTNNVISYSDAGGAVKLLKQKS